MRRARRQRGSRARCHAAARLDHCRAHRPGRLSSHAHTGPAFPGGACRTIPHGLSPGPPMAAANYGNVLEMIGNTPLMAVRRIDTGPCELFLKLENQNPGGSIKDRIGLYLIEAAERSGRLRKGGTLIEATAGNTGLG